MNYRIDILIEENRKKLTELIENNAPYEIILKQSELLDDFIIEKIKSGVST